MSPSGFLDNLTRADFPPKWICKHYAFTGDLGDSRVQFPVAHDTRTSADHLKYKISRTTFHRLGFHLHKPTKVEERGEGQPFR
jgi:hypothetical protein